MFNLTICYPSKSFSLITLTTNYSFNDPVRQENFNKSVRDYIQDVGDRFNEQEPHANMYYHIKKDGALVIVTGNRVNGGELGPVMRVLLLTRINNLSNEMDLQKCLESRK